MFEAEVKINVTVTDANGVEMPNVTVEILKVVIGKVEIADVELEEVPE